ncbi:hypothetical protein psyc5s11_27320 [Clostridium gelidum]|uniref:Uncharacterized protein n=1 Tax=Clostridium gelidum TaxID=704125 RepID=A0ABM7T480_9CLOT|nr:hypothetical protein psyc5s11_27320 [Clostridium gelidum]
MTKCGACYGSPPPNLEIPPMQMSIVGISKFKVNKDSVIIVTTLFIEKHFELYMQNLTIDKG